MVEYRTTLPNLRTEIAKKLESIYNVMHHGDISVEGLRSKKDSRYRPRRMSNRNTSTIAKP